MPIGFGKRADSLDCEGLCSTRLGWNAGSMKLHSLDEGFPLEDPPVLIPWGLSQNDLRELFDEYDLRQIALDTYEIECTAFNGLRLKLYIHFDERRYRDKKYTLSFLRVDHGNVHEDFEEFQRHLEETFGTPTTTAPGEDGFPYHRWELGVYDASHVVIDRHGYHHSIGIGPPYHPPTEMEEFFDLVLMTFPALVFLFLPLLLIAAVLIFLISRWK